MDKVKRPNPDGMTIRERVARLEGKVSLLTQLNMVELSVLIMILLALLSGAV